MYELLKILAKGILGVVVGTMGLNYLFVPYEKLKAKNPNLKSPKTIKICGAIMVVLSALMIMLAIIELF